MHNPLPHDLESAMRDAEAFGRATGQRTATGMAKAGLTEFELKRIGQNGVTRILDRAEDLAAAGVEEALVATWIDRASDAFRLELERTASLLTSSGSGARH